MAWRKKEIAEQVEQDVQEEHLQYEKEEPYKVVFTEGCFDGFEGTQEELDELIAMIHSKVADGSIFVEARPLDPNDEDDLETLQQIAEQMENSENRTLN